MDEHLRDLERRAATGDLEAQEELIRALMKATGATYDQIRARYRYPIMYQWCVDALTHGTVYHISEFISVTEYRPRRTYAKFWTIRADSIRKELVLDQFWPLQDQHVEEWVEGDAVTNTLHFMRMERHPWGPRHSHGYAFHGDNVEEIAERIFRFFGLKPPYLKSLFQVVPQSYFEDAEEAAEDGIPFPQ